MGKAEKCPTCAGSGVVNPTGGFGLNPGNRMVTCPACNGSGRRAA